MGGLTRDRRRLPVWLLCAVLAVSAPNVFAAERFIRLAEIQVWADWRGPEVGRLLSKMYNETGRSHVFRLRPTGDYFVWDRERMRGWIQEAARLGCFNLFNLGDDTPTADGHLFTAAGLNPKYRDFYFETVAYAHQQGFMVGVEPRALPRPATRESVRAWAQSFLDPALGREERTDVIKMSIEWFGAYRHNPEIAPETEHFIEGIRDVNPKVLVYLDSIGGAWRQVRAYHSWIMSRYPEIIISHYLNTDQVEAFRAAGAANMMVQINPQEFQPDDGQFFVFHDRTVKSLKEVVARKVTLLSVAGVNYGYNAYNYDLFLDVIRPYLGLVKDVEALRAVLGTNKPVRQITMEQVRSEELAAKKR